MAKVKLIALASLAGKFKLPYDEGQVFSVDEKLASEIVGAKYAEYTDGKPAKERADKKDKGQKADKTNKNPSPENTPVKGAEVVKASEDKTDTGGDPGDEQQ